VYESGDFLHFFPPHFCQLKTSKITSFSIFLFLFLFLAKFRQSKNRWAGWGSQVFCLGQFCVEAKVVMDDPQEDLARFGYKLNLKI